jgi:flagellar biosynthesis protein FlhG
MRDPALSLRQFASEPGPELEPLGAKPVYVIGSGKGGVGKSVVATLLAQAYAEVGSRVLLVDGSQNLGHLHVMLGVGVEARLEHVLKGEVEPRQLVRPVLENLWLLPSDSGAESLYALPAVDQARLHHRLAALYDDFDLVVVDAGPGLETVVRLATMGGTRLIVVTVPEIAALTDGYALIKLVHAQLPALPIDVLVNRAVDGDDVARAFERLGVAAERFLGKLLTPIGGLTETAALKDAMRRPGGLVKDPALASLKRQILTVIDSLPRGTAPTPALVPVESPRE